MKPPCLCLASCKCVRDAFLQNQGIILQGTYGAKTRCAVYYVRARQRFDMSAAAGIRNVSPLVAWTEDFMPHTYFWQTLLLSCWCTSVTVRNLAFAHEDCCAQSLRVAPCRTTRCHPYFLHDPRRPASAVLWPQLCLSDAVEAPRARVTHRTPHRLHATHTAGMLSYRLRVEPPSYSCSPRSRALSNVRRHRAAPSAITALLWNLFRVYPVLARLYTTVQGAVPFTSLHLVDRDPLSPALHAHLRPASSRKFRIDFIHRLEGEEGNSAFVCSAKSCAGGMRRSAGYMSSRARGCHLLRARSLYST
ncbi:hypothetical protein MSAN_02102000 [Mycena sanguinolenta]|uniref:Uncharacterized protein n=1 Tax=Mycena sanguinolenta TaxID=230812 RepID=A0A8H7CLV6_9AGAR|nr:hypothetical protein MSAN_02102000 [Mycena sanguinolenta]